MEHEQARAGQRVRVDCPGVGDHGQVGTITQVRGDQCYVHIDWDQQRQHVVMFYEGDLEPIPNALLPHHPEHPAEA